MAYRLFHELFPAVAEQETRTLTVLPGTRSDLPAGDYGFLEMFCDEPGCDCRRVFFSVVSSARQEIEAVVAWGWETPAFYATWMNNADPQVIAELKGPVLNLASPATSLAPALLELTRTVLLHDAQYVERVKRHYQMFRQRIEAGRPSQHIRARGKTRKRTQQSARTGHTVNDGYERTRPQSKIGTSTGPAERQGLPHASGTTAQTSRVTSEQRPELSFARYEITTEPMEDRQYRRLPRHVKAAIERLHDVAQRRPRQAIPELRALITQHPHVPQLYNYLSVAHARAGQRKEAEAVVQENYQRNPEYLFARLNYAEVCLARKDYAQVADIFAHTFDLHVLYPQRKRFHLSEVANFLGVAGLYFLAIGQRELAELQDTLLQQIAPDFPLTTRLHKKLFPGLLRRFWHRVTGRT
jgi:tetratricopeptide (TPR) repeat protein